MMAEIVAPDVEGREALTSVAIGGLGGDAGLDQHSRGVDAVGLDRGIRDDGRDDDADAGEHLAADRPGVIATALGVGDLDVGKGFADHADSQGRMDLCHHGGAGSSKG